MSDHESMTRQEIRERDRVFLRLYLKSSPHDVTENELEYFRVHPDQIDEVTAPVNIHKLFLWVGTILGLLLMVISKVIKFHEGIALSDFYRELIVDIASESGIALIGTALTAYVLGILLDKQQENAARWRSEIRRRLADHTDSTVVGKSA